MTSHSPKFSGIVGCFNEIQGHGRIRVDDGREITVHFSGISGEGYRSLEAGDRVEFDITAGTRGLHAENVIIINL